MILLVTYFPWDHASGGAFIVRSCLDALGNEPVRWVALSRPSGHVPFTRAGLEREAHAAPAAGNVRLKLDRFWKWYYRRIWSGRMASLLSRRIRTLDPRVVWFVADASVAPLMLRLMPTLRKRRVHLSLHDDMEPVARREGASVAYIEEVRKCLALLREMPVTADAVTEELLEKVAPVARRKAIVTMPVDAGRCATALVPPAKEGTLTLGFSGNFFGDAEFRCLLDGLRVWSARTGRDWRLRVFGNAALGDLDSRIEARGFTPMAEVRGALRGCDLLFLPCPLELPEMMTSLPTKLVTYLETGRLILAFAPSGSATERVINEGEVGRVLTARVPALVAGAIDTLIEFDTHRATRGWRELLDNRFSATRIARDLAAALR